jgi:hypothetical protein
MGTVKTTTASLQPTTVEELLAREEALAIQRIAGSVQRLGEDVCAVADLRRRIREHPILSTGLGALLGFVGGPLVPRAVVRISKMTSRAAVPASGMPRTLPGLVWASLRAVRAHRSRGP